MEIHTRYSRLGDGVSRRSCGRVHDRVFENGNVRKGALGSAAALFYFANRY
jgi:hypothetical protein